MRVFGFAGWSGSGKTTLIEQLIPRFTRQGLTVSLVKHAHHEFDLDQPGKDSFRHREAGCTVEGFKAAAIPKLEVYRAAVGKPLLHPGDPRIVAVATDSPLETTLPVLPLADADMVATFILRHLGFEARRV